MLHRRHNRNHFNHLHAKLGSYRKKSMFHPLPFILLFALHFAAAVWLARSWTRSRSSYALLALAVAAALIYENAVLAAGASIGEGPILLNLNRGRFFAHILLTPLLIIQSFGALRRAGFPLTRCRALHALACLVALALIAIPALHELPSLELAPRASDGLLRYVNVGKPAPPWGAIAAALSSLIAGIALAWRRRWPWLALGAAAIFAAAGAGGSSPFLGNAGEAAYMLAIAATEAWLARRALAPPP